MPDEESLGAAWVAIETLRLGPERYPLRGYEVIEIFEHVARGGAVHPLELLTFEGVPWA